SQLLAQYRCMLLLDGLDEVTAPQGLQAIHQFMEDGPQHQYVMSCRTVLYRHQLGPFDALVLDDLSDREVQDILGEERYNPLNDAPCKMVRNRTLLKILIELRPSPPLDLPKSKGHLVQRLVQQDLGLDEGGESRRYGVDGELLEGLLESLAHTFHVEH